MSILKKNDPNRDEKIVANFISEAEKDNKYKKAYFSKRLKLSVTDLEEKQESVNDALKIITEESEFDLIKKIDEDISNKSKFELLLLKVGRKKLLDYISGLNDEECEALLYDWDLFGRPKQFLPEGQWLTALFLAGRGFGKTRVLSEAAIKFYKENYNFFNFMGATKHDVIDINIEGDSGILRHCHKSIRPIFKKNDMKLVWPNGAQTLLFSAEDPERLRGKQHSKLLFDELCSYKSVDIYDQAMFGLRLGNNPQSIIATTPKPTELLRKIMEDEKTIIIRGSTYENKSNLANTFIHNITKNYEGTRLGRQELYAEVLEDNNEALFNAENIDINRVKRKDCPPLNEFEKIVIGVDPAITAKPDSDLTGIIAAGRHINGDFYVFEDKSLIAKPLDWAREVVSLYDKYQADYIIAEKNQGGDLVESNIKNIDKNVGYKGVSATRGKILRAEPVSNLYQQNKVHHVGLLKNLEDEMCKFIPDATKKSPDRLDALVWAITALIDNSSDAYLKYMENRERQELESSNLREKKEVDLTPDYVRNMLKNFYNDDEEDDGYGY